MQNLEEIKTTLYKAIKNNSYLKDEVIILGNLIEVKISDSGEFADIYKYANPEDLEKDDYDFDADYLTTIYLK